MNMENQNDSGRLVIKETLDNIDARGSDLSRWRLLDSTIEKLTLFDSRFNYTWAHDCRLRALTFDHCL